MAKKGANFKYHEPRILQEIHDYIAETYSKHYVGEDNVQLMDLVFSNGDGLIASKFNVQKYINRFGRKNGDNIEDLYKAAHYLIFMIHALERQNAAHQRPSKNKTRGSTGRNRRGGRKGGAA